MQTIFLIVLLLFTSPLLAQNTLGYGFIGGTFGGLDAFRYGIGGQGSISPRVALGGEIGGIQKHGSGLLVSGNLFFHPSVRSRGDRVDPFITGGVSFARAGGENGAYINIGGGINYWFQRNFGLRGEFRGYPGGGDLNSFSELRFGIVFR